MKKGLKLALLTTVVAGLMVGCGISDEEQAMIDNYPTLEKENADLKAQVEEAKPWFDMKEEEKLKLEREEEKLEKERLKEEELAALKAKEGVLVFEDDNVKINFKEVKQDGVYFNVENKTDAVLTIQADSVSVNGISSNDLIMSDDVSPKSKGVVHVQTSMSPDLDLEKLFTLSGQLRVIDFNNMFDSYDASFVNVDISK